MNGHTLVDDPPAVLTSVTRRTCTVCGRAELCNGSLVYGSATTERCSASPACTGLTAGWCPNCGDCICDRENDMSSDTCPLHNLKSTHADDSESGDA